MINIERLHNFIRRFFRRLKFAFRWGDMWYWEYESCNRCGINYRLPIGIKDSVWIKVNGKREGCLCVNCFFQQAEEKKIDITLADIERLYKFNPKGHCFHILYPNKRWESKMKQEDFSFFAMLLLKNYMKKYPQYHCKKNYCCGICDRFYPCLFHLLEEIKIYAETQRKELGV